MLLALTVLNYHYQFCPFNFLNSFSAVVTFMMISGFYISMVINERYGTDLQGTLAFYGNRLLRLFPAYWAVLVGCRLFWPNQPVALSDIFLIPQPFLGQFRLTENGLYLGQMYTVALELMFYAIAPFIVLRRLRWLILAFAATAIYTAGAWLAIWKAGLPLQGDVASSWEYQFFPGTLLYFFAGALVYRFYLLVAKWRWSRLVGPLALPLLVAVGWLTPSAHRDVWTNNFSVFAFYALVGGLIPFLFIASKAWRWDRLIGDLSYPLYIVHFPIIDLVDGTSWLAGKESGLVVLGLSLAFSIALYALVDRPVDRWRHWATKRFRYVYFGNGRRSAAKLLTT